MAVPLCRRLCANHTASVGCRLLSAYGGPVAQHDNVLSEFIVGNVDSATLSMHREACTFVTLLLAWYFLPLKRSPCAGIFPVAATATRSSGPHNARGSERIRRLRGSEAGGRQSTAPRRGKDDLPASFTSVSPASCESPSVCVTYSLGCDCGRRGVERPARRLMAGKLVCMNRMGKEEGGGRGGRDGEGWGGRRRESDDVIREEYPEGGDRLRQPPPPPPLSPPPQRKGRACVERGKIVGTGREGGRRRGRARTARTEGSS